MISHKNAVEEILNGVFSILGLLSRMCRVNSFIENVRTCRQSPLGNKFYNASRFDSDRKRKRRRLVIINRFR